MSSLKISVTSSAGTLVVQETGQAIKIQTPPQTQILQLGSLSAATNQQITQAVASATASAATALDQAEAAAQSAAQAASAASSIFAPWYIPAGSTYVIPANFQVLSAMNVVADGNLQADGYLIEV